MGYDEELIMDHYFMVNNDDDDDMISRLPEAVVAEILSLVPIETAVSTSVLSKRWCNRWRQLLPSLKLNKSYGNHNFFAVADKIIKRLISTSKNLNEVELLNIPTTPSRYNTRDCTYFWIVWIPRLCSLPLKEFSMSLEKVSDDSKSNPSIPLPPRIFLCRTLVTLKLEEGFNFRLQDHDEGSSITLPNLRNLDICVRLRDDNQLEIVNKLLKSCPLLEKLRMREDGHVWQKHVSEKVRRVDIVLKNLKRLALAISTPSVIDKVTIDTPKLEHIEFIFDTSSAAYTFVGTIPTAILARAWLLNFPDEISFQFRYQSLRDIIVPSVMDKNCVILSFTLQAMPRPVLENLRNFVAYLFFPTSWHDSMRFLERCPNVEAILFYYTPGSKCTEAMDAVRPADCFVTKVRSITVSLSELEEDDAPLMVLVKYMLTNAKVLELLDVDVRYVRRHKGWQMYNEEEFCDVLLKSSKTFFSFLEIDPKTIFGPYNFTRQ